VDLERGSDPPSARALRSKGSIVAKLLFALVTGDLPLLLLIFQRYPVHLLNEERGAFLLDIINIVSSGVVSFDS